MHSHILPGIDDGAKNLDISLEMARMAVADGTTHIACTPHFLPGSYENTIAGVATAISALQETFVINNIALNLVPGGDVHITPDLPFKLADNTLPKLGTSRYFLFEPEHHILTPGIVSLCKATIQAGFVPILTHPERLTWIETHYDVICELGQLGLVIQLTAGSITGSFGERAKYWSDRMLDEGRVDIIASDAHNTRSRPPGLSRARDEIARRLGENKANQMVRENPRQILDNKPIAAKNTKRSTSSQSRRKRGFLARIGFQ